MPNFRGALLALACVLAMPLCAQTSLRERAEAVLRQAACQDHLPGEREASAPHSDAETGRGPRRESMVQPGDDWGNGPSWQLPTGMALGQTLANVLLWTIVAIAAILVLAVLVRSVRERAATGPPSKTVQAAPKPEPRRAPAADFEQLAASGDHVAALHALLQHALLLLHERQAGVLPSTTGREALRLARAVPDGVAALRTLVQTVELCWFGGRPAARADYDAGRQAFMQWSAACQRR